MFDRLESNKIATNSEMKKYFKNVLIVTERPI